ncbi:MAG: hypothetical protein AAFQ80_14055 [Cyanobacteria bacterium J06621_8]
MREIKLTVLTLASTVIPGIGQIYAGKMFKGYLMLFSYILLIAAGGWLTLDSNHNPLTGIAYLIIAFLFLPLWSWLDAYFSAKSVNSPEFESTRKQTKDPWLAVFLSGFIPGLGHAYLRKWLAAALFFGIAVEVKIRTIKKVSRKVVYPRHIWGQRRKETQRCLNL